MGGSGLVPILDRSHIASHPFGHCGSVQGTIGQALVVGNGRVAQAEGTTGQGGHAVFFGHGAVERHGVRHTGQFHQHVKSALGVRKFDQIPQSLQRLVDLGTHLGQWSRALPDGQTLRIEVTDLDLAGEIRPFSWHDARVLRGGADWPQMSLRYTLQADGRTLKSGEARLSDLGYSFARRSESLGYEKAMIDRWFRQEFSAP